MRLPILALAVLLLTACLASAGPSVSVHLSGPRTATAGTPWSARLVVAPRSAGRPALVARLGSARRSAQVTAAGEGAFRVRLVLPAPGSWRLSARLGGRSYALGALRVGRETIRARSLYGLAREADGDLLLADGDGNRVLRADAATGRVSVLAGTGVAGSSGDGGPAARARLSLPTGVAVDAAGNVFVADGRERIRRIDAATGTISTVARGMPGALHVVVAPDGALLVTGGDTEPGGRGHGVRRIDPATGASTFLAGGGAAGGADGPAATATFDSPHGLRLGPDGDVYTADAGRLRRIDAATGTVSTIAGTGAIESSGDGGPATSAAVDAVRVAVDARGRVFAAESGVESGRVRMIGEAGTIRTILGGPGSGLRPYDVLVEADGTLLVADHGRLRVLRLDVATGAVTTVVRVG